MIDKALIHGFYEPELVHARKAAYILSFTSVKEGKITQKDPFDYEEWGL